MKKIIFLIILNVGFSVFSQNATLDHQQHIFDSDTCCWRKLSAEGKYNEAASLIVDYINNSPNAANKHSLNGMPGKCMPQPEIIKKLLATTKKRIVFSISGLAKKPGIIMPKEM